MRQRQRKLAGRPVRIVVCAYPSKTIEPVIGLLKSAVLYGDEVVLHSPLASMLAAISAIAQAGPQAIVQLTAVQGLDAHPEMRAILNKLDEQFGPDSGNRTLADLANPKSLTRALLGQQLRAQGVDLDEFDRNMADSHQQFADVADQQISAAGLDELKRAVETGVLSIYPVDIDSDLVGYRSQLADILHSPGAYPVFDDQLGKFVSTMIETGAIAPGFAMSRGRQAATADRLLGSLPTFPAATMDEIVDIRDGLRSRSSIPSGDDQSDGRAATERTRPRV